MSNVPLDLDAGKCPMTIEEVAHFLRKSTSWVYKHWRELGAAKFGGSLIFPAREDLYGRLFSQGPGMEIRLHPQKTTVHRLLVSDKKGSIDRRNKKKGGIEKSSTDIGTGNVAGKDAGNEDRHNLL